LIFGDGWRVSQNVGYCHRQFRLAVVLCSEQRVLRLTLYLPYSLSGHPEILSDAIKSLSRLPPGENIPLTGRKGKPGM
jgi:hypothetical protein